MQKLHTNVGTYLICFICSLHMLTIDYEVQSIIHYSKIGILVYYISSFLFESKFNKWHCTIITFWQIHNKIVIKSIRLHFCRWVMSLYFAHIYWSTIMYVVMWYIIRVPLYWLCSMISRIRVGNEIWCFRATNIISSHLIYI